MLISALAYWGRNYFLEGLKKPKSTFEMHLKFDTCKEHTSGWTNIGNLENAPYYKSNETYDVTNHVFGGSGYEIWKSLQSDLNFTSTLYKR